MKLNPNQIAPSQDFLKPHTVRFIFECLAQNKLEDLPPAPIVRKDKAGNYVAIDGHNLLAVCSYRGEDIEVHLASNAQDGLQATSEGNVARNADLLEKYDSVLQERDRVAAEGIRTFQDLIARNPELFDDPANADNREK